LIATWTWFFAGNVMDVMTGSGQALPHVIEEVIQDEQTVAPVQVAPVQVAPVHVTRQVAAEQVPAHVIVLQVAPVQVPEQVAPEQVAMHVAPDRVAHFSQTVARQVAPEAVAQGKQAVRPLQVEPVQVTPLHVAPLQVAPTQVVLMQVAPVHVLAQVIVEQVREQVMSMTQVGAVRVGMGVPCWPALFTAILLHFSPSTMKISPAANGRCAGSRWTRIIWSR
jgi:hypothetical protein